MFSSFKLIRKYESKLTNTRASLASVVAPFGHGFATHWSERSLKECVVYNVALVIFAFDDPVAGECFTLADTRKENGGVTALPCFY